MSSQCRRPSLSAYATARPLSFLLPSYCSLHAAWLLCPLTAAGNSGPFWEMLVLLACCDKSTIVALEAIKGLVGASFPTAATIAAADGSSGGSRRPVMLPDEHAEADIRVKCSMGWQLLLARAGDEAPHYTEPAAAAAVPGPGAVTKQSTMARCGRARFCTVASVCLSV
jgi:hypothetical protein